MEQVCLLLDAKAAKVTMAIKQSGEKVLGRSEEAASQTGNLAVHWCDFDVMLNCSLLSADRSQSHCLLTPFDYLRWQ